LDSDPSHNFIHTYIITGFKMGFLFIFLWSVKKANNMLDKS